MFLCYNNTINIRHNHLKKYANLIFGGEKLGNYNELIRKFDKIRDYMRDFYIYGFKSRNDFKHKSSRTYDNEKRRIESYMGDYMKWGYSKSGKKSFITMNCGQLPTNPLYSAWKSKAFTDNDIILHFNILSALNENSVMSIEDLTNTICENSGLILDIQTVRNKCNEYVKEGLLTSSKQGRALFYSLSATTFNDLTNTAPNLTEAIKFFQGDTTFGEIGNFIASSNNIVNNRFLFKHYYIVHTLEDGILLDLLTAIRNNLEISFVNHNEAKSYLSEYTCVPLKIFVSATTGRRYLCVYNKKSNRFFNYRLDHIKSIKLLNTYTDIAVLNEKLARHIDKVWSVSFGGRNRSEIITMKLYINEETEQYILKRIEREGRGGKLTRVDENTFIYTVELFDSNDISPWIKTFMGRIIQLEGTNTHVVNRFYNDIKRMKGMYDE